MTLQNYHQLDYYQKKKKSQNHPKKHGKTLSNFIYKEKFIKTEEKYFSILFRFLLKKSGLS